MTRDSSTTVTSASYAEQLRYHLLAEIDVRSSTLYLCTGNRFIYASPYTYSPGGGLGGVEAVREESDVFPRAVTMWLTAVGSSALSEPISEQLFNKSVKLYRTFLTDSLTVVDTPQLVFRGRVNQASIRLGDPERGNYFEIEAESRLKRTARSSYFNQETLTQAYSGDTFFIHVPKIPTWKGAWGEQAALLGSTMRGSYQVQDYIRIKGWGPWP